MGVIQVLAPSLVRKIAAGEVIERPASAVKELLENAVDAGATRIDVELEDGGKRLIRVVDNGSGMYPEDLQVAFVSHATSKLQSADDLFNVHTMGFRGEALSSIGEIGWVRTVSRTAGDLSASELEVRGGEPGALAQCAGPVGTTVEVRNLFFNTPARRKFLKTQQTEMGHVIEAFNRVALARPGVHMTLRHDQRRLQELPAVQTPLERIRALFGDELADHLLAVHSSGPDIQVRGYAGHPHFSRASSRTQYVFLNGRYIRDRSILHAVQEAYRGLLMSGRQPVLFLYIELPPDQVDVNVHPTKIEVRFRNSQMVYSHVLAMIREKFLSSDLSAPLRAPGPRSGVPRERRSQEQESRHQRVQESLAEFFRRGPSEAPFVRREGQPIYHAAPSAPGPAPPGAVRPPESTDAAVPGSPPVSSGRTGPPSPPPDSARSAVQEPASGVTPSQTDAASTGQAPIKAVQMHDAYLVAETPDGIVIIDQHALHERILYNQLRRRLGTGAVEAQRLLLPETVELTRAQCLALMEHRDTLRTLGIEIDAFGEGTVAVRTYPAILGTFSPAQLVRDFVDHLLEHARGPSREDLLEDLLHMMACRAAVKAGQRLTPEEVEALMVHGEAADSVHHCPHGRPTALVFTRRDLDKQFGRQ